MRPRYSTRLRTSFAAGAAIACALGLLAAALPSPAAPPAAKEGRAPNILLLTIDTLRTDRMSAYGYERPTSPNLDRLLGRGARFTETHTVEPLTNPALTSMVTSLLPHEHGGTRNGLPMRPGLPSLPKLLAGSGYETAAMVGNWTLRDDLSGLGEHFDDYQEMLTKRRWYFFQKEADAADLTDAAIEWLEERSDRARPFLLWVHYIEPHSPYVFHPEFAERLGIPADGNPSKSDRYDTEIAFVDHHLGRLLAAVEERPRLSARTIILFASDHGESLGEHGYWGHGRNLHEPGLHIPFGFVWPGRIPPQVIEAPAMLVDVAPTLLGLLGLEPPPRFHGHDWSEVFAGAPAPEDRTTWFQAHRGAVLTAREARNARQNGLLEVGLLAGGMKEILDLRKSTARLYDLRRDPGERTNLLERKADPSAELAAWHQAVEEGLAKAGTFPPPALDDEAVEKLKALGYTD